MQQTWLAALRNPPTSVRRPRAWLATVLRSWLARSRRSAARRSAHERAVALPRDAPDVADEVARADTERLLADAVAGLREPYRTTLVLRYFEQLSLREVARATDAPLETVRTRVRRALALLRSTLDERWGEDSRRGAWATLLLTAERGARCSGRATTPSSRAPGRATRRRTTGRLVAGGLVAASGLVGLLASNATVPASMSAAETVAEARTSRLRTVRAPDVAAAPVHRDGSAADPARRVPERDDAVVFAPPAPWTDTAYWITDVALSRDARLLATVATDGRAKLWSRESGRPVASVEGLSRDVVGVEFAPGSTALLIGEADGTLTRADPSGATEMWTVARPAGGISAMALHSRGGQLVLACRNGDVVFVDVDTAAVTRRVRCGTVASPAAGLSADIAVARDGRSVAVAFRDGEEPAGAFVVAADDNVPIALDATLTGPLAFGADSRTLFCTRRDSELVRVAVHAGSPPSAVANLPPRSRPTALWVDEARDLAVVGAADGTLHAFAPGNGTVQGSAQALPRSVLSIDVLPASDVAVAAGRSGEVVEFDVRTLERVRRGGSDGHTWVVSALVVDPWNRYVATSSWDRTVKLWDPRSRSVIASLEGHRDWAVSLAVSGDGELIASGAQGGEVRIWSWSTRALVRAFAAHDDTVSGLAFDRRGERLASGGQDRLVRIWDVATGRLLRSLEGHEDEVRATLFLRDGRRLVTAGEDATIRVWDLSSGRVERVILGHRHRVTCLAELSPRDGSADVVVAGDHDGMLRVWNVNDGRELASAQVPVGRGLYAGWVNTISVAPDGESLAVGAHDTAVVRYALPGLEPLERLVGHAGTVYALGHVPGTNTLLAGGAGKRLLAWHVGAD